MRSQKYRQASTASRPASMATRRSRFEPDLRAYVRIPGLKFPIASSTIGNRPRVYEGSPFGNTGRRQLLLEGPLPRIFHLRAIMARYSNSDAVGHGMDHVLRGAVIVVADFVALVQGLSDIGDCFFLERHQPRDIAIKLSIPPQTDWKLTRSSPGSIHGWSRPYPRLSSRGRRNLHSGSRTYC